MFALPTLLVLLSAAPAQRTAIIDVDAPDMMMGLGSQVTKAILSAAAAQKLPIVTPEELRTGMDPKKYEELRKCGGKAACAAQILEPIGVTRAVLGQLGRDEKNYLLKLWLVDLKSLTIVADVDRSILIAARRFQKDVEQAVPPLLRGEREARGTLIVQANLADAQITVNGEFAGAGSIELTLKPGKYEVKVERKKYLAVTRLMNVEANQKTKEDIKLLLKPGEIPDDQLVPALVKKDDQPPPPSAIRLTAPTWISGSLAVAAAGVGLYFGLTARSIDGKLQEGLDPMTMVYAGTRKEALDAQRNALFANISFGVAGAALAATVLFVILDATRAPEVQVAPAVSAEGAGVTLGGRF